MNVALDLGAHACRSLFVRRGKLAGRRCRAATTWLHDGPVERSWLELLDAPYFPCDDFLAVPGDHAERLAQVFPIPLVDVFSDADPAPDDPIRRQLVGHIVESLLPTSESDGDLCCFSQPGYDPASGALTAALVRRRELVARLIRLRGYEPLPLNPAVALALAEMEPERYTGVAICVGASGSDLALTHRGNPAVILRIAGGGRAIDEELARRTDRYCDNPFRQRVVDREAARRGKEGLTGASSVERQIAVELHRRLAGELAQGVEGLVGAHPLLARFTRPLTVVLGGGIAGFAGFDEMVREKLRERLPSELVGTIRCARTGEFAIARGCLIQATLIELSRRTPQRLSA